MGKTRRVPLFPCVVLVATSLLFLGCAGAMMPKDKRTQAIPYESFEKAETAFDMVRVGETTLPQLEILQFDLKKVSRSEEWNPAKIRAYLLPNPNIKVEDLKSTERVCLQEGDFAHVFPIEVNMQIKGEGSRISRELDYKIIDRTTGSKLWAIFCIRTIDKVVVHKARDRTPIIDDTREQTDILGPGKKFLNIGRAFFCLGGLLC